MGVLKRDATNEQARALVMSLMLAEDEIVTAICHTHGLLLARSDKLSRMANQLRDLRHAIEAERRFEYRRGSGWWTWNERTKDWEREVPGREPRRVVPGRGG